jgi:hypothetical protein
VDDEKKLPLLLESSIVDDEKKLPLLPASH